jgi:hypothetical protein
MWSTLKQAETMGCKRQGERGLAEHRQRNGDRHGGKAHGNDCERVVGGVGVVSIIGIDHGMPPLRQCTGMASGIDERLVTTITSCQPWRQSATLYSSRSCVTILAMMSFSKV